MSLDRVAVAFKVGDNNQYRDGMPIDIYREKDWGKTLDKILSSNMHRVYAVVEIDPAKEKMITDLLNPVGFSVMVDPLGSPIPDPVDYRVRGAKLDFKELVTLSGDPDLETKLRDPSVSVPLINGTGITDAMLKDSRLTNGKFKDFATISNGSYTIGAAQNYATWSAFGADITTLTGNLTGTQQTATSETARCAVSVALAGFILTLTSASNPLGNFGGGYQSTFDVASNTSGWFQFGCTSASSGAVIRLYSLNLKYLSSPGGGGDWVIGTDSNTTNIIHKINDCLLNSNSKSVAGIRCVVANGIVYAFNNVMVNANTPSSGYYAYGILPYHANSIIENNTVYNYTYTGGVACIGIWNLFDTACTFTNNAVLGNNKDYCYTGSQTAGLGNGISSKNASSDTSGSEAGLRSLSAANEFVSTDIASADFLKVKSTGSLAANGVATSIAENTYGIRGNVRPH